MATAVLPLPQTTAPKQRALSPRKQARQFLLRSQHSQYDAPITPTSLQETTIPSHPSFHLATTTMSTPRILLASIGNPAPYTNTLHSAGHTLLSSLRSHLGLPQPTKSRPHANGHISSSPSSNYTLWTSPTLMNVSGPAVAQAWSTFTRDSARSSGSEGAPPILVVLHDELEAPLGAITVRSGWASPRGHNGLKSIQKSLNRDTRWWRVGVGIGRPESRDPDVVAGYVLRKMSAEERGKVEGSVGKVVEAVERIGREAAKEGC